MLLGIPTEYIIYGVVVFLFINWAYKLFFGEKKSGYTEIPRDHYQRAEKQIARSVEYTNRPKYKAYKIDFNADTKSYGTVRPAYLWLGFWAFEKKIKWRKRYIIAAQDQIMIDHIARKVVFGGSDIDAHGKLIRLVSSRELSDQERIEQEKRWIDFVRGLIIRQAEIDTIIDREWLSEKAMRPLDHQGRIKKDGSRQVKKVQETEMQEGDQDVS